MNKMKVLLLSLVLGLSAATAVTTIGCKKAPENGSSNWFTEDPDSDAVTVHFANGQVSLNQYESIQLVCTVKGNIGATEYRSSDETIATVDANGVVTAKGVLGDVTITALADGVSDTCTVTVKESPYAPQIVLNSKEYTVELGETLQFSVATAWNKTELTEAIDYAISFAEDSKDANAEISMEGNIATIVTKEVGTFNVVVSTTVRGLYTSEMLTVNVVAPKLKLQPTTDSFQPTDAGYAATISTTDLFGDLQNSLKLDFIAMKGNQTFEDAMISWTVKDDDLVSLNEGTIFGKKRGVAVVTGTLKLDGETATVDVAFNVIPPEVRLEETTTLEVENLANLKLTSELVGSLYNAELHGVDVSARVGGTTIVFNKAAFPKQAALLGEQELVINTDVVRYVMPVTIYTMIINDAAELDAMRTIANTGETEWSIRFEKEVNSEYYDGYFVLGNDINYGGKAIKSMTDTGTVWSVQGSETETMRGFKGIFDGKGYNIDGVTVGNNPSGDVKQAGGIFGYITTSGIVRNVSFTNAVLYENQGFICARGDGLIENVSVSYSKIGGSIQDVGKISMANTMGTFFSKAADSHAKVRNCLIDATAADIILTEADGAYNIKLAGAASAMENVIVLCPDDLILKTSGADIMRKSHVEVAAEPDLASNFDPSIWTKVDGVLMFANLEEKLDINAEVDFLNVDPTIVAGFDMIIRGTNPYVKIEMVEPVEGVTFDGSILSATGIAFKKEITLKMTSLFNSEKTATKTIKVDSYGTQMASSPAVEKVYTVYDLDPVLRIGDNSWVGDADMVYVYLGKEIVGRGTSEIVIDWTACEWGVNEVAVVRVNDLGEDNETREYFMTNMKVWYKAGERSDATKLADSAFSTWLGHPTGEHFTEVESDIEAPEGFETVTRRDCATKWGSAMGGEYFNDMDVSGYKDIWFALKITNARYIFQTTHLVSNDWVYFHYTQTGDGVWVAEVTLDNKVYKTEFDIPFTTIRSLLYRNGWADGFLIYNNQGDLPVGGVTSVYSTEILAIAKD